MRNVLRSACFFVLGAALASSAFAETSGADVYKSKCNVCHGPAGDGNTPAGKAVKAASFSSPEVTKMPDADLMAIIRKGKGKMPPWKGALTDDQIKDVLGYIHTLQK